MQGVVGPDDVKTIVDGDVKRNKERANDHILAEQAILKAATSVRDKFMKNRVYLYAV